MKVKLKSKTIQEFLAKKNKTQNWLAKKFETSSGYMSQLMNGTRNPSPKMREKIMQVLEDCKFDDLFILDLAA